jgi:hypothetical protein
MNPDDANRKVASRFKYRADPAMGDPWHILDTSRSTIRGDCEDYALTVLSLIEGGGLFGVLKALWSKRAAIWFCIDPQGDRRHILEYRKVGFLDNQQQMWGERLWYEEIGYRFKKRQPFLACLVHLILGLVVK